MKKLQIIKIENSFFSKLSFFVKSYPARHVSYKVIKFATNNKSVMAKRLPSSNLEYFLRRITSTLTRY